MIAEVEIEVGSEELSIAEASLEFGLSEVLLRRAIHSGRLLRIAHRWRQLVRREDVAALDDKPQSQVAHPTLPTAQQSSIRQSQRVTTQAEVCT